MEPCIFCEIVKKEIPAHLLYDGDSVIAFPDIQPQAPVHVLIIPKKHYAHFGEIPELEFGTVQEMFRAARMIADRKGLKEKGYRLVMNVNREGGQTVFHAHMHLLAGRQMGPSLIG